MRRNDILLIFHLHFILGRFSNRLGFKGLCLDARVAQCAAERDLRQMIQ